MKITRRRLKKLIREAAAFDGAPGGALAKAYREMTDSVLDDLEHGISNGLDSSEFFSDLGEELVSSGVPGKVVQAMINAWAGDLD